MQTDVWTYGGRAKPDNNSTVELGGEVHEHWT